MSKREACPQCGSRQYKRNGRIHTGKQNHKCKACGRAFVLVPENRVITEEQRAVIERLLVERISLRGICRVIGVGLRWLLHFMAERFTAAPEHLYIHPTAGTRRVLLHRLEAKVDELWSFVGRRANRHWVWIAMDALTRQILAFPVGDRSRLSAHALWEKIPAVYQAQATFYTDCYEVYKRVARSPAPHYLYTIQDQAHSRLTSAITAPQTPRWWPPAAGDSAAQPLTGTQRAALLGTCARARATRRHAPSDVIPPAQHRAITKLARTTNHIERFNCTLRQRVLRLVRATLSFSKKLANHIGAIRYFICDYNLTRCAALPG